MKICKEIGMENCGACFLNSRSEVNNYTCWLNFYAEGHYSLDRILHLLSGNDYESPTEKAKPYFLKSIEINQPEIYSELSKLLVLQ
jgi:hypothetical protein